MHRRTQFIQAQTVWVLVCLLSLILLDAFTLDLFAVTSFVGFLVIMEVTTPVGVSPQWRKRLRWFLVSGFAIVAYVTAKNIVEYLPEGWL